MTEALLGLFSILLFCLGIYYALDTIRVRRRVLAKLAQNSSRAESSVHFLLEPIDRQTTETEPGYAQLQENIRLSEQLLPVLLWTTRHRDLIEKTGKEEFQYLFADYLWCISEIDRAITQLRSDQADAVVAGCHVLSALRVPYLLPEIERAENRWHANPRVAAQIDAAKHMLLA